MTDRRTSQPRLRGGNLGVHHALLGFLVSLIGMALGTMAAVPLTRPGADDLSYLGLPIQMFSIFILGAIALRLVRGRHWTRTTWA